ncbi:amino acid ABC transporter substrate-binding protein [Glycomyces buryatensis]|uniref:Amino acid ABC transporter substrate-binding protein n=2 Tax=Glycomyces buryatensis TaxID=2570927 RepID=A0A4S8QGX2_9ACTN|nr:amino acid ABC transporter substrate-binding protein [Glycomyces buryatensis]
MLAAATAGTLTFAVAACGSDEDSGGGGGDCEGTGMTVGTILPQTGSLAFLGPPEFAGVDLAIEEINAAGGVLDECVEAIHEDSGDTSTDIASQSADSLIAQDVDAVVGAASSGVSFQFIDKLYEEGIVQISPANTSPDFTTYERGDYYFRTAPSDVLQGRVLADQVIADGHESVAILALQDSYGTGLADAVEENILEFGGEVVMKTIYDPNATEFSAEVSELAEADADAVVLITFNEITNLAPELVQGNLGPQDLGWYFVDGNLSNYGDEFPEGMLEGTKGTLPGADPSSLEERLLEVDPELEDYSYAAESYDATTLLALAAAAGGAYDSETIKENMIAVSRDGTECTDYASCVELLDAGEDIDYNGASGPIEFSAEGDVSAATIGVYEYGADNTYTNVSYNEQSLE